MDYYAAISNVVSNNSQFLLLLVVTYCVLKIIHLEKKVKYLRFDHLCLKELVMENENDEDDEKTDTDEENEEDENDPDYDPEEEGSDTSEDEGLTI